MTHPDRLLVQINRLPSAKRERAEELITAARMSGRDEVDTYEEALRAVGCADATWIEQIRECAANALSAAAQLQWIPGALFLFADLERVGNTLKHYEKETAKHDQP